MSTFEIKLTVDLDEDIILNITEDLKRKICKYIKPIIESFILEEQMKK